MFDDEASVDFIDENTEEEYFNNKMKEEILAFISFISEKGLTYALYSPKDDCIKNLDNVSKLLKETKIYDFYGFDIRIDILQSDKLNEVLNNLFDEINIDKSNHITNVKVNYKKSQDNARLVLSDISFCADQNDAELISNGASMRENFKIIRKEIKDSFNACFYLYTEDIMKKGAFATLKINRSEGDNFDCIDDDFLIYNKKNREAIDKIINDIIKPKFKAVRFYYTIDNFNEYGFYYKEMILAIRT